MPERDLRQRFDALKRANEVRTYRAGVKRDVRAGRRRVVDLIVSGDELLETMKLMDLLLAAPKIGRVKANRALRVCGVSPSKTVGGLTERQRGELAEYLR